MSAHPAPRVGGSDPESPTESESPTTPKTARTRSAGQGDGVRRRAGSETRERRVQRARDPEARKRALADAVIEIVAEVGIGRTTHRAVAARAGLPLGATTYYFPTLDDLIAAGLAQVTAAMTADLRVWGERLATSPDFAEELVTLTAEYLLDRRRTQIEYELYVAAARDVELRSFALAWLDGLNDVLVPRVGSAAAQIISALLDGAMIQSVVTGKALDKPLLAAAINQLTQRVG